MAQRALITGITGQDAAYLTKLLLDKGYEVYGAHRRSASMNVWRLHELGVHNEVKFVPLDLMEFSNILRLVDKVQPDEVYNLAAQSFVGISFEEPIYTGDVDGIGVVRLLEAVRLVNPKIRFYQASTSEMFGKAQEVPQSEMTPFHPRSPYGVAKLYGHWVTVNYREAYGMRASSGILFNHESPLRGLEFVTRKITAGLAHIRYGQQEMLELGNMEASRDWGFALDYVHGMWLMLQQAEGGDYVLATGHTHTVRQFVERAAEVAGFQLVWHGEAEHLRAVDRDTERVIVRVSPEFYRPAEVEYLVGDSTKARTRLGWDPSVQFEQLVEIMMEADLRRAGEGTLIF
jgi:GDPmannose 4,6-dehydratase